MRFLFRGMTPGALGNAGLAVLLVTVSARDFCFMSRALFIYLTRGFLVAAGTEGARHLAPLVFDHCGRMGGMALQTICIDHIPGMGLMTFQA